MRKLFFACTMVLLNLVILSQNANHPTVSSLNVQYKSLPQQTLSVAQTTNTPLKVVPLATLTLVNAAQVSSINLKVVNNSGAIEYESNFLTNTNSVSDASGRKVFQLNGNTVLLNIPRHLATASYSYQIVTKNTAGVASPVYTLTY